MTNAELIETAKEAMNDLWELDSGMLLKHEHDQMAYNYLRLFSERLHFNETTDMPIPSGGNKCQSCHKNLGTEQLHTCPYKSEIHDDDDAMCNCCDNCRHECTMDI